jgi:dephospho-CoA kinase
MIDFYNRFFQDFARVAVVGLPTTGKTTFVMGLQVPHKIIHTDHFIGKQELHLINAIEGAGKKYIVEGVEVYKLLLRRWDFDIIIHMIADKNTRWQRSVERRKDSMRMEQYWAGCWKQYLAQPGAKPVIKTIDTSITGL